MKKAVIYARYSSERQTEQSIEGQLTVCNKFAKDNDFIILDEYIDRAMTGTNDNRPAFKAMIKDSAKHEWDYVLVYKGDRFSRNRVESAINKKALRDNGVKVVSVTENIPDSPEGIILESLLEGMAEYYSAELSQKVKRGLNESRQKKQFTGGILLLGYDVVNKKPVINEKEADIIRKIYEDYANGSTAFAIEKKLAAMGAQNKKGKPIDYPTVYRTLRQQKYAGNDIFPAIVSQDLKERVNSIISQNKRAPGRRKAYANYLLSGKLICGECGGLMTGEAGTSKTGIIHHYYKCFSKKKHTCNCKFPSLRKEDIENKVFEICCEVINSTYIPHVINIAYKIHQEELGANIAIINLESQINEKKKAIKNIVDAIEQGIFTSSTKARLTELETELEDLTYKLDCEKSKSASSPTKEDYYKFLSSFMGRQADNESFKQETIEMLIRRVVVFRDKIRITFNYSPNGGKGKERDYETSISEYQEAKSEHSNGIKSSNLFILTPPKVNNPNTTVFISYGYWGVWASYKTR